MSIRYVVTPTDFIYRPQVASASHSAQDRRRPVTDFGEGEQVLYLGEKRHTCPDVVGGSGRFRAS